jgi:hypothetical protein
LALRFRGRAGAGGQSDFDNAGKTNARIELNSPSVQSYIGINFSSSKNPVFMMAQIALFSAALSVLIPLSRTRC